MKLFYRKYGSGPPLFILHGLYGSSGNWTTIAHTLGNSFTVYLPDQRNHGQSPHSSVHDYDSMSNDLHELLLSLNIKKIFLAGHSMGGKTAIAFALKWPEMLYGLLVADISPFVNENTKLEALNQHLNILSAMNSFDPGSISSRSEGETYLKEKIASEKVRSFIMKNLQRLKNNRFSWKLNVPVLLEYLPKIMEGIKRNLNMSQQVKGFPVIFIKGEKSDYLPESDFKDILNVFPAAEFIVIPDAGHWIHADNPDEVIKSFRKLLGDV